MRSSLCDANTHMPSISFYFALSQNFLQRQNSIACSLQCKEWMGKRKNRKRNGVAGMKRNDPKQDKVTLCL
jgi:hypothetical protein